MTNDSALRLLVRSLLRESIDTPDDMAYFYANSVLEEYERNSDFVGEIESLLGDEEIRQQIDPGDEKDIRRYVALVRKGLEDPELMTSADIERMDDRIHALTGQAPISKSYERFGRKLVDLRQGVGWFQGIIDELQSLKEFWGKDAAQDAIRTRVKIMRREMEVLPQLAIDYVEFMRALSRLKRIDLESIDPDYMENIVKLLSSDPQGFVQGVELAELVAS